MIITVGNQKGGVGKTTIATNMAVLSAIDKKKTLLIDADIQGSSMDFRSIRGENDKLSQFQGVQILKPTIHKDIKDFANFENIFIDAGGRESDTFRSSIMACDYLLIPIQPSPYDIWASENTFKTLKEARIYKNIKAGIVLNQVISSTNITDDINSLITDIIKEYNLDVCLNHLVLRVAYKKSAGKGKGIVEYDSKSKGAVEISNLYEELMNGNTTKTHEN